VRNLSFLKEIERVRRLESVRLLQSENLRLRVWREWRFESPKARVWRPSGLISSHFMKFRSRICKEGVALRETARVLRERLLIYWDQRKTKRREVRKFEL